MKIIKEKISSLLLPILIAIAASNLVFRVVWKGSSGDSIVDSLLFRIMVIVTLVMTLTCAIYWRLLLKGSASEGVLIKIRILAWIYYYVLMFAIPGNTFRFIVALVILFRGGNYNHVNISESVHCGMGVILFLLWFIDESRAINFYRLKCE